MGQLVSISVDVTKLDKAKLYEGKNGAKYASLTVSINDSVNEYGKDVSVWQEQSKEERDAKAQRNFCGNGKTVWSNNGQTAKDKQQYTAEPKQGSGVGGALHPMDDDFNDLPF